MATLLRRRPPVVIGVPRPVIGLAALGAELVGRLSGTVPMFKCDKTHELRCPAWTCSTERAVADLGFEPTISLRTGLGDRCGRDTAQVTGCQRKNSAASTACPVPNATVTGHSHRCGRRSASQKNRGNVTAA